MQKLIIVGNGFDLAHHLKTRYQDFAKGYSDDPRLQEFQSLVAAMNQDRGFANEKANDGHEIRWYDFEMCMEHLSNWILYKSIADSSEQTRLLYDAQMKRCNRLFDGISPAADALTD